MLATVHQMTHRCIGEPETSPQLGNGNITHAGDNVHICLKFIWMLLRQSLTIPPGVNTHAVSVNSTDSSPFSKCPLLLSDLASSADSFQTQLHSLLYALGRTTSLRVTNWNAWRRIAFAVESPEIVAQ